MTVEAGISDEVVARLRALGHHVMRARGGYGGYQGILIDWENGVLHGAPSRARTAWRRGIEANFYWDTN